MIIGPHRSAFTNIIFSQTNTNIIEIIPDRYKMRVFEKISKVLNLKYIKIERPEITLPDPKMGDMRLKIDEIDNVLNKLNL